MISDLQTNTVFLADALESDELRKFHSFLKKHGVQSETLKWTQDIYCRDYMPLQIDDNQFVQFVFKPGYYKKSELGYITNPVQVLIANKLENIFFSRIILDGGNIVKWKDKVLITDRVIIDNRNQFQNDETALLKELEETLQCQVILIPAYPKEETGHSDGLIRFVDENTVFINEPEYEPKDWLNVFLSVLKQYQLSPVALPCPVRSRQETADGLYINFLQVGKLVVVPQFGLEEDSTAFTTIRKTFGNSATVVQYDAPSISAFGGGLNCATWTIRGF